MVSTSSLMTLSPLRRQQSSLLLNRTHQHQSGDIYGLFAPAPTKKPTAPDFPPPSDPTAFQHFHCLLDWMNEDPSSQLYSPHQHQSTAHALAAFAPFWLIHLEASDLTAPNPQNGKGAMIDEVSNHYANSI